MSWDKESLLIGEAPLCPKEGEKKYRGSFSASLEMGIQARTASGWMGDPRKRTSCESEER
jgi:hypothetical protein